MLQLCQYVFSMSGTKGVSEAAQLKLLAPTVDFERCMSEFSQGGSQFLSVGVWANGNHGAIMETTEPSRAVGANRTQHLSLLYQRTQAEGCHCTHGCMLHCTENYKQHKHETEIQSAAPSRFQVTFKDCLK